MLDRIRALMVVGVVFMMGAALTGGGKAAEAVGTYGPWHSSQVGGGGFVQGVVLCPDKPDRAYAYVDVAGILRSDDRGRSWTMLHGNWPAVPGGYSVRGVSVDPRNSDRVLAAVGDQWDEPVGMMSSTDAGTSWKKVLDVPFFGNGDHRWSGALLARHPAKPDVLLTASVDMGVWKSRDNGETWGKTAGADGLYPSDILWDRSNHLRAWMSAQTQRGWLRGVEGNWRGGLYRSDNGGEKWVRINDDAPTEMLQDPKDPRILYGIFGSRDIRRSLDAGKTWESFTEGLTVDPNDTKSPGESEYNALAAGPDFILTASTLGTFYRLECGTTEWVKVERQGVDYTVYGGPRTHEALYMSRALANITVDPKNPDRWFCTDWFAIYQTEDGGKNWITCVDGLENTVAHVLQQDPTDPNLVYLGLADIGYFRSENGGTRFQNMDYRKGISNNIKCLALSPLKPERVFAVGCKDWHWESNKVFVSNDKGKTWKAAGTKGLPKDTSAHHTNSIAVHPADPDKVYVVWSGPVGPGGGGVYESTDGGRSWAWIGQGLPEGGNFFTHDIWAVGREIAVGPDGRVVVISRDSRTAYVFDPAKRVWDQAFVSFLTNPTSVVADTNKPGAFYISADSLYATTDGGAEWNPILDEPCYTVTVDMAVKGRLAVGTRDGVKVSVDGGARWTELDRRLPYRLNPIVAFAGDRVLAATLGCGVFWMELPMR